ncbi:MAG: porin family protein [Bacteroidaceae bacterium]|nr:porin family protein [Bacteroidaceae bacterium]
MKKISFIIIALCMLVVVPANAQVKFGIKAGTNLVESIDNFDGAKADGFTGFFVGPTARVTLPIVGLGVAADILYSQTGAEIGGEKIKRNSLEIPVYLRYDLALPVVSKIVVPFIAVGPQFGFTLGSADQVWKSEGLDDALKFEYKKSNLSLNVGAGATLFKHVQAHVNYNIALGKTSQYTTIINGAESLIKEEKTNTWQISLAYIF